MAQGFLQKSSIDYEKTYSPMMDATIFRYLIYLAISEGLNLHLMDVVTAYLYGSLGDDIHMKICEGIQMSKATNSKHCGVYSIKQQRSLH